MPTKDDNKELNGISVKSLKIADDNSIVGEVTEMSAKEKAQHKMTYWILGGIVVIFALSAGAYIFTDGADLITDISALCHLLSNNTTGNEICNKYANVNGSKNNSAKEVFEFCKAFLPPIVTLVLGAHYVKRNTDT